MAKQIPVFLFGAGGIGSELIEQILASRLRVAERNQLHFDIVSVADSRSWLWDANGLSTGTLRDVVMAKKNGRFLPTNEPNRPSNIEILDIVSEARVENGIVVDVTAVDGMEPLLDRAGELGHGVVLANKKALAGPWSTASQYYDDPNIRYESTVGGGQPVIATLRYLLDVNDPIYTITGQMSGTLGFVSHQISNGHSFSEAVLAARKAGYTEPDPREDLSGEDVMRKVLILGRTIGWPMEAANVEVESLYPPEMARMNTAEFLAALPQLDKQMAQRVKEAADNDMVLRYIAELCEGHGRVGFKPVPISSPLANLKYISFRTQQYSQVPLLIGGKGAGIGMTAAGVLGDIIALARERLH